MILVLLFQPVISHVMDQILVEERVQYKGFYEIGWESSAFYRKTSDNFILSPMWLNLDSLYMNDSLRNILNVDGFMKVEGIKRTGGDFGHLGAAASELVVKRLIIIDTTFTLEQFFYKEVE